MNIPEQIESYIQGHREPGRSDLEALHRMMVVLFPKCRLWYLDGKNSDGKVVANPNIGYGSTFMTYADGSTKEFYRIGISANTGGISVYIMDIKDKHYLSTTYAAKLGKAKVTGYCIKFKTLKDIHVDTLKEAIVFGMNK